MDNNHENNTQNFKLIHDALSESLSYIRTQINDLKKDIQDTNDFMENSFEKMEKKIESQLESIDHFVNGNGRLGAKTRIELLEKQNEALKEEVKDIKDDRKHIRRMALGAVLSMIGFLIVNGVVLLANNSTLFADSQKEQNNSEVIEQKRDVSD